MRTTGMVGLALSAGIMFSSSAGAGPATDYLRNLPRQAEQRARNLEVEATVRLQGVDCITVATGRVCSAVFVPGIMFSALERDGSHIASLLTISRPNVRDERNIGRAINAFFLATMPHTDQKLHDLLVMGGASCVMNGMSHKSGRVELEGSSTGCVITVDR